MADFKAWLLRKIDECPPTGQCCLEAEINAIQIPTGEEITEETYRAVEKLVRAFIRYLLDCICSALLPPCPTCEDPAVKLACVQIDDCNVCQICNLERTFLLTEHNLRYWIPLLHGFGEALERLCCEFADRFKHPLPPAVEPARRHCRRNTSRSRSRAAFFKTGSQLGEIAASNEMFPNLVRVTGLELDDVRSSLNLGGNFARITARDPGHHLDRARASPTSTPRGSQAGNAFTRAFEAQPGVRDGAHRGRNAPPRRSEKKVDAQLKDLNKEIDKRLSPKRARQAKVIKELKQQLDEQRDANES